LKVLAKTPAKVLEYFEGVHDRMPKRSRKRVVVTSELTEIRRESSLRLLAYWETENDQLSIYAGVHVEAEDKVPAGINSPDVASNHSKNQVPAPVILTFISRVRALTIFAFFLVTADGKVKIPRKVKLVGLVVVVSDTYEWLLWLDPSSLAYLRVPKPAVGT